MSWRILAFLLLICCIVYLARKMEQIFTYKLADIGNVVQHFWQALGDNHVFAFSGEMSAGKTTFIHTLCDYLQVEDTVSSPTFSLINEYHFRKNGQDCIIYHMDWYRLKSAEEAVNAGIEDCLLQARKPNVYCFVEWPEKAMALLPLPHLWLAIETTHVDERKMVVKEVK